MEGYFRLDLRSLFLGGLIFAEGGGGGGWGFLSELNGNQIRISKCTWKEEQNRAQLLLYRYKEGVPLRYELVLILIKGLNFRGGGASHEKLFSTPSPSLSTFKRDLLYCQPTSLTLVVF